MTDAARRRVGRTALAITLAACSGAAAVLLSQALPESPETALRRTLRQIQASLLLARTAEEEARLLGDLAGLQDPEAPGWQLVVRARPRDLAADRPVAPADVRVDTPPFTWGADVDVGRTAAASGAGRRLLVFRVRLRDARNLALLDIEPGEAAHGR